ncbi:MAG: TIGR03557 family F420-dependent LLM class oxidoreductase [Nocardioides sp.]|uniref:TIGR03557 family F420-dependent LLM class oxidoreductase n=1 Tax=Nocardioides nematodiphilus TaxID=2849669 RepID=UPI001CD92EA9|nr:TIGR03557 family F420-dependent LLM class oxidoreductase [Nocardioides nematodiphilus]MCA1983799.1 TIGR03557 family F420-dependent LLM class oxidoreductase [Nocardioides nematodiphilus]
MVIGYFLSTEEYGPDELLEQAVLAEEAGFEALAISDHFHPWNDEQGQSAFVWSVIGALAKVSRLPVTTTVTCPTVRMSPVITAQAAATSAALHHGGFRLGVGSGEALNEHIHGDRWPTAEIRLEMLEEAVDVMRRLWTGERVDHHGKHYTVEDARIYTLPETPPEIYVSGFGPAATKLAARIGDGYVTTTADAELLDLFRTESGGKPAIATIKAAYAPTEEEAVGHAHRLWSTSGLPGELAQVLASPKQFEQGAQLVTEEMTRNAHVCGPDLQRHAEAFDDYASFEEVYVANIGPHYAEMIRRFGEEVLPAVRKTRALTRDGGGG